MNCTDSEKEEQLRESSCTGDLDKIKQLVESKHVNINSQNKMNGWTALHWACKRNHVAVVKYLLAQGADKTIQNAEKQVAAQLTNTAEIRVILDYTGSTADGQTLDITPNYIQYPPFPYNNDQLSVESHISLHNQHNGQSFDSCQLPASSPPIDPDELVLKARVAHSLDKDFIEVELNRTKLTYDALMLLLTKELNVDRHVVHKIRKLPNTIVRKDKDVKRLQDYQEIELVLTSKGMSTSHRGYEDHSDGLLHGQILY